MQRTVPELFWAKLYRVWPTPGSKQPPTDCWEWAAFRNPKRHSLYRLAPLVLKAVKAHRYVYETLIGPIPLRHIRKLQVT